MKTIISILLIFLLSCFFCSHEQISQVEIDPIEPDDINVDLPDSLCSHHVFEFTMTEDQENMIYTTMGEKFGIEDPKPTLYYDGIFYKVNQFKIRGASSLQFRKKSFAVKLKKKKPLELDDFARSINKFKLMSLVFDSTYMENSIAFGFFKELDLWPLLSFYTEVRINENTHGLYLFIEDVENYFVDQQNSSFILKREYFHDVEKYALKENSVFDKSFYIDKFKSIYRSLKKYEGKELYDTLCSYMDIKQYFTKIAVDLFLKNGDYTDEVYFYTKYDDNNREVFGVCPWDYDDLFARQPHEIGSDWSVGNSIKERYYSSMDDILADVGEKLLFSIEDDLDYIIATDDYLYSKYLKVLEDVFTNVITESTIENVFANTLNEVGPFYNCQDIIEQSKYDFNKTSKEVFYSNLEDKKDFLIKRRAWILKKLDL